MLLMFLFSQSATFVIQSSRSNVAPHSNLVSYYANFLRAIFHLCVIRENYLFFFE